MAPGEPALRTRSPGRGADERVAAAERLRRSTSEIATVVGEGASGTGGKVDAVIAGVVQAVADALVRGDGHGAADGTLALRLAQQAVIDGATPDGVRRIMHDTVTACRDLLLGRGGDGAPAEPGGGLAPSVVATILADVEFSLLAAFEAVTAPEPGPARLARMRHAFLRRVLTQPVADAGAAADRARRLGVHAMSPLVLALFQLDPAALPETASPDAREADADGCALLEVRVGALLRHLPGDVYGPVVFDIDPLIPEFAVVVASHVGMAAAARFDAALAGACERQGLLAALVQARGIGSLHVARLRLEAVAPILARIARFRGRVVTWEEAWPYVVLQHADEDEAREIQRDEFGALLVERRGALARVETWQLLVRRQLTAGEAAQRLNVAESTVRERRREIERRLGHRIEEGLFRAQVASYLFDLWRDDMPKPGDPWWSGPEADGSTVAAGGVAEGPANPADS